MEEAPEFITVPADPQLHKFVYSCLWEIFINMKKRPVFGKFEMSQALYNKRLPLIVIW